MARCTIMTLGLPLWLARRALNPSRRDILNARDRVRHTIRQNYASRPKGKGNKAWKRAQALESAWRRSGGFYVTDYLP